MKRFLKFPVMVMVMVSMSLGIFSNGINLNSNGSKAIAMGGAFVGLADDYSAVFWNPAGLTQMTQKNLALFGTDILPKATYEFDLYGIDASTETKHYPSPGLGFFTPMGSHVVAGIYAYVPSGIGSKWKSNELAALSEGASYNWKSYLAVVAVSPAVGIKVTPKFSVGMALNLYYGKLQIERPALGQYEEDIHGMGVGATFGMLFKPMEKFSVGFTFRTPYKATLKGDANMSGAGLLGLPTQDDAERKITTPAWIAGGICVKPTPKLTLTADLQYTNWAKMDTVPISYTNAGWIAYFENQLEMELHWKDAVQIRFGMEYMISKCFALRAGYYFDPRVGVDETQSILLPEISYNWVTVGFGIKKAKFILDFAIEYGLGKEVNVPLVFPPIDKRMPGIHKTNLFVPNIALTILL